MHITNKKLRSHISAKAHQPNYLNCLCTKTFAHVLDGRPSRYICRKRTELVIHSDFSKYLANLILGTRFHGSNFGCKRNTVVQYDEIPRLERGGSHARL